MGYCLTYCIKLNVENEGRKVMNFIPLPVFLGHRLSPSDYAHQTLYCKPKQSVLFAVSVPSPLSLPELRTSRKTRQIGERLQVKPTCHHLCRLSCTTGTAWARAAELRIIYLRIGAYELEVYVALTAS
jgi:hypothetical protein